MNRKYITSFIKLLVFWALASSTSFGQNNDAVKSTLIESAKKYLLDNRDKWQLSEDDVLNIKVYNAYTDDHNGLTHIYFAQLKNGIELYNAILNMNILPDGKVLFVGNRFFPHLSEVNVTSKAVLLPKEAVNNAAGAAGILMDRNIQNVTLVSAKSEQELTFKAAFSLEDIDAKLYYYLTKKKEIKLAWRIDIAPKGKDDHFSIMIDAANGETLAKTNRTIKCSFGNPMQHLPLLDGCDDVFPNANNNNNNNNTGLQNIQNKENKNNNNNNNATASYNVFKFPVESPIHGNRTLITDPADPIASPYGWHDVDGKVGAEYTITRGNNVHAYDDIADTNKSPGNEPNGGTSLNFNFPYSPILEPDTNRLAAITNLFYVNNYMHDFAYKYGFNEVSGNFQENNYGRGGIEGDYVKAEAQDGGGSNNANFSSLVDGRPGTMQMYLWDSRESGFLSVNAPADIAGMYEATPGNFGPQPSSTPLVGDIVLVDDGTSTPTLGCQPATNDIAGKIALVDRGNCLFTEKVYYAQQKGAIAVIVANFEEGLISMGGSGTLVSKITIPSLFVKKSTGTLLRQYASKTANVTIAKTPNTTLPVKVDGSFDNGIMAHEYAHGISNRLIGGGSASCLENNEQMGEGWSDFFTLVTTARPEDLTKRARGIGTFALRQPTTGAGIRAFLYTPDMTLNPYTLGYIIGMNEEHSIGEVWATVLWDLYWAMVDKYGFDPDVTNGKAGNNKAIQLVMDGFKMTACAPGFLDGRDAILAADLADFKGDNQCLIWDVFARRGMGVNANQGDTDNSNDDLENFDSKSTCLKNLKLTKLATPTIDPNAQITYTLIVTNDKPTSVSGIVLTDEIPTGTTYVANSANATAVVKNNIISFDLGTIAAGSTQKLTYAVKTGASGSIRILYDDMENPNNGLWDNEIDKGSGLWDIDNKNFHSGKYAWSIGELSTQSDISLRQQKNVYISGKQPVLRFFHTYDTDPGNDGGIVEVSRNKGKSWENLGTQFFRQPYTGRLAYGTFGLSNLKAFWGKNNAFIATYADLSKYVGDSLIVRFRFGSDAKNYSKIWAIDDVEYMDMLNYNTSATLASDQGDKIVATAEGKGTVINPRNSVATNDTQVPNLALNVYPNPSNDIINVAFNVQKNQNGWLSIFSNDGREVLKKAINLYAGNQIIPIEVAQLPTGFYFIKLNTDDYFGVEKLIKQ